MKPLAYTLVIATFERPAELRVTLESIATQTHLPAEIVIVDAARDMATRGVIELFPILPIRYELARAPSAARQRNQGAEQVRTPLVAFLDDDVLLPPATFAKLCAGFANDSLEKVGGVAARIVGMQHTVSSKLLWWYYRLQAGYADPSYGTKLFGPAINCLPTYEETGGDLIPSEWLNSTCVLYRTPVFQREKFPEFDGYSFLEDVHLSARVGRTHRLYFHRTATFEHRDAPSTFKRHARQLARTRARHQRLVAREILGLREPELSGKLLLHRLFISAFVLRTRGPGWRQTLLGTWV